MFENISEIDWARAAAYIDGEGSISIANRSNRIRSGHQLNLDVTNVDPRLPIWFRDTFGGTVRTHSKSSNPNRRTAYRWTIRCGRAAEVIKGCLPYLILKRDQAEIALAFQSTFIAGRGGRNHKITEEEFAKREEYKSLISDAKWKQHEWPETL